MIIHGACLASAGAIAGAIARGASGRGLVLVMWLASMSLGGCAARGVTHGREPVTRKESPKLTGLQEKVFEARDQSSVDVTEPYWPYRLGEIYAEADSTARAESALKSSLARDPSYAPALALLSKLYYHAGRHQDGVELLEAARTRPGAFSEGVPPALLGGLALHYEALGRHDLAAAVVAGAQGSDPGKARSALVYVTLRGEHPAAAADPARAAVDDDPRSAANQNNYGLTRLRAGDPKAARDAFLKAIEIDPKRPGPYYNLAILERFYFFDDEAAARWLKAYRERSNVDPDGLFKLFEKAPVAEKGR
ncbi:MAG: tetratricopeptide repeat protein [Candidatus Eiseniibacteriota bacterium]